MARTSNQLTQKEVNVFQAFAQQNGIVLQGDQGVRNGEILGGAIINSDQDITPATLAAAFAQVRDQLTLKSLAEQAYDKIAAEHPASAQELDNIYPTLGLDKDYEYQDKAELLQELRGYPITAQTVRSAMDRIAGGSQSKYSTRKRTPLHYPPAPLKFDPRQHASDGEGFLGKNVNLPLWKRRQLEREQSEKENQSAPAPVVKDAWESLCRDLFGSGTHSQQAAMKSEFDHGVSRGLSYRQIYANMQALKRSYQMLVDRAAY